MRLVGAILAGGAARRFGSDKALAAWRGRPLIAHAADALRPQVEQLLVCGRDWCNLTGLPDRPSPGLGPLGGLCAALHHAAAHGYDAVLTSGCDLLDMPADLATRLTPGPAVALGQPLLGLWPATLALALDAHLAASADRSLRLWIAATGARTIDCGPIRNINTPDDLRGN